MTTTTANARDEICAVVLAGLAAWPGLAVRWPGVEVQGAPAADLPWARVTVAHKAGGQGSLSCEAGVRRWRREGVLTVQCFAPLKDGSLQAAEAMACAVRDAVQSAATPGGVWFRDVGTNEVGPDASWYQVNTNALFTYDEVR